MKKVLIMLLMIAILLLLPKTYAIDEEDKVVISAQQNAILADVGDVIDLNKYVYVHNQSTQLPLSSVTLTSFSDGITLDGMTLTVHEKGSHPFLLQYQSANIYVYVVAKEPSDDHYVLYEENYDGMPNGKLPTGYSTVSGSAGIQSEKLYVAGRGGTGIVTLPNYLRSFMNYIIEVDFTILEQDNDARWASVMFRYSTENYFQMAIRKDATAANGIEFAKRISGQWNVTNTASFHEVIQANKMYHLKIDVLDSTVKEYIDDELYITHDQALEYKKGLIGVQSNGANSYFDNFKIILPLDYVRTETYEFTQIPSVYQPETGIVNPATVLTYIDSKTMLETYLMGLKRPQTGILRVDDEMNVVTPSGEVIDKLYDVLIDMDNKMIPAFDVESVELAEELASRLKLWGIIDSFIISDDANIIKTARDINPMMRGVLDRSNLQDELTKEKLFELRQDVNNAESVALILNLDKLSKEKVNYLQQRLVTVWTRVKNDDLNSHWKAVLSGVNGMLTQHPLTTYSIYEQFTDITHVREVFFIAHRGLHNGYNDSEGPENSKEVALAAIKHGAKIIETDVHLTFDEDVVVMHDNSTQRTAEITFNVSEQFLGALQNIKLKDVSNTGKTFYIPSYREYLLAIKEYEDVVLFIEIKPTNKLLLEKVRDITVELEMEDRVVLIMFGAQNAIDLAEVMPSMAKGYLTGSLVTSDLKQSMLSVLTSVVPMKTTLNPSYAPVTADLVKALTHRGITIWPWTIDDLSSMIYHYNSGVGGITTNTSDLFKDALIHLVYEENMYEINFEHPTFRFEGHLKSYSGESYPFRTNLNMLLNEAEAVFDNTGKLTSVTTDGKVSFYTKANVVLPNGSSIHVLSDFINLNVVKTATPDNPATNNDPTLIIVLASVGGILVVGGTVAVPTVLIKIKKGKNKGEK